MNTETIYSDAAARGWIPWAILTPFLGIAFVVGTALPLDPVLAHYLLADPKTGDPVGFAGLVAFLLGPFAALGLVVLGWTALVERRPFATIGLGGRNPLLTFAIGLLSGLAMIIAILGIIWAQGGVTVGAFFPAVGAMGALAGIVILLACFALQSSVEELVFRGWMLSSIARRLGPVAAIVLSTAVFTLLHFGRDANALTLINTGLFALFACGWALRAGNVWGVMGWHAGWNWLLGTGFQLPVTGIDTHLPALLVQLTPQGSSYLTGGAYGPEDTIAATLVLTVGTLLSLLPRRVAHS